METLIKAMETLINTSQYVGRTANNGLCLPEPRRVMDDCEITFDSKGTTVTVRRWRR